VDKFEDISSEGVFQISEPAVPLDFDAPADHIFRRQGFGIEQLTRETQDSDRHRFAIYTTKANRMSFQTEVL
jgi:hypothetical protein